MHLAFHVLRWLLGGLLYLAAILLYENEEGKVQNRLEELWLRVAYRKDAELSRAIRFLQGVASLTNDAFDRVLGESLWSVQAVGVSLWFSFASLILSPLVLSHLPKVTHFPQVPTFHLWLIVISCVNLGLLPVVFGRFWAFVIWTAVVLGFLFPLLSFALFAIHRYGFAPVLLGLAVVLMMLFLSFGFDVIYISVTRWMLRRMFQMRRLYELIGLIVLDVVLAIVLVGGPIEFAVVMMKSPLLGETSVAGLVVVMFNFGDFIACSVFFIVMLAVLAHRLMWPVLERPIYALHRYGVIRNKKLLWGVGSALLVGPQGFIALGKYIIQHL